MMPGNERLHAAGARRLFDVLRAAPQIDAETDEELDLFVCDLLSDADKSAFAERIRKDPILATEAERRKAESETLPNREELDRIKKSITDKIRTSTTEPQFSILPGERSFERKGGKSSFGAENESQSTRKLPSWLLMAALIVVLGVIGGVIMNQGDGLTGGMVSNNQSDPSGKSDPSQTPFPKTHRESTDNAELFARNETIVGTFDINTAKILLTNPEVVESGLRIMGDENREIERKYEGHSLIVTYYDRTKKRMPFVLLPVEFRKGTAELADEVSRVNVSTLATLLKSRDSEALEISIEVHARVATVSETDKAISRDRAEGLRSLLETQGVPSAVIREATGVGTDGSQISPQLGDAYTLDPTQPLVLVIRSH